MKYYIFHKSAEIYIISDNDIPQKSNFADDDYHAALSTALSTKGVKVTNADVLVHRIAFYDFSPAYKDYTDDSPEFLKPKRVCKTVIDSLISKGWKENQLYDLPEGYELTIRNDRLPKCQKANECLDFKEGIKDHRCRISEPCQRGFDRVATIVPTALPEKPEPSESQDVLWTEAYRLTRNGSLEDIIEHWKSKYTIQRKP